MQNQLEINRHLADRISEYSHDWFITIRNKLQLIWNTVVGGRSVRAGVNATVRDMSRDVLQTMPVGVVLLNHSGVVTETNTAAVELLGRQLQGVIWRDAVHQLFVTDCDNDIEVRTSNGHMLNVTTYALPDQGGQVILLTDVTRITVLRAEYEHVQRLFAMGNMLANLAHQIRTPLTTAMLYNSLRTSAADDNSRRKLQSSLQHLERLVNNMLLFARGKTMQRKVVDIISLATEVEDLTAPLVEKQGCWLNIVNRAGDASILANRDAMITALQNLVVNAAQASDSCSEISLEIERTGSGRIEIRVRDHGHGIDPEMLPGIFNPFFTTRSNGTGLGLAVVHSVVHSHGGEVLVKPAPDRGTVFCIMLPEVRPVTTTAETADIAA
jgi:two-component system sensor histidine kinase FlrB